MKTTIEEIIERIGNVLNQADGKEVAEIANMVLGTKFTYLEDGVFNEDEDYDT